VDKYPTYAGREADPLSLGEERVKTWGHRARLVKISTPTTRQNHIWRAYEGCGDRRTFHVPCPHCGTYQRLVFGQVKWPKSDGEHVAQADAIKAEKLAYLQCIDEDCKGRISDHHKPKMLARGVWVSQEQTVTKSGDVVGPRPKSDRVGFHISALYSPWVTWSDMASEFLRSMTDPGKLMNFRNSWLAEPFEEQIASRSPMRIVEKEKDAVERGLEGAARVVPEWSRWVIATADVQKDHLYFQVDAWGLGLRSKRLLAGVVKTFEQLHAEVFTPSLPFMTVNGELVAVSALYVDSGFRKDEVTRFAQRDAARVKLTKGASTYGGPIVTPKFEKESGVQVMHINTMQAKDTLDALIGDADGERWQVYSGLPHDYATQLASEHKVLDPQTRMAVWRPRSSGAQNHWFDCSAMSCAVAHLANMQFPADPTDSIAPQKPQPQRPVQPAQQQPEQNRWVDDRRRNWLRR
jgi:phage terminase large subunit GpA-like protein